MRKPLAPKRDEKNNKNQIITQPILKDIDGTYSDIDTTMNIELQE